MKYGKQKQADLPIGMKVPEDMPYERYIEEGKRILSVNTYSRWWMGDWLNFGEKKYGEMYAQAEDIFGLSYSTLSKLKMVAHIFPVSRRRPIPMSISHHQEVMSIKSIVVQEEILNKAAKRGWNTQQLRAFVARLKRLMKLSGDDPEVALDRLEKSFRKRINFSGSKRDVQRQIHDYIDKIMENAPEDRLIFFEGVVREMEYREQV